MVEMPYVGSATLEQVPESYWVACVLLILSLDDDINSKACVMLHDMINRDGNRLKSGK